MRRVAKIAAWIIGLLVGLPLLLVAIVLIGANTDAGRRLIVGELPGLTGGMIAINGISGRFPDALRVAHVEIRDAGGAWLTIDDLALDWSPFELLHRTAHVERVAAARIAVPRLPTPTAPSDSSSSTSLPVHVQIDAIDVARLDLGAPVAGRPASLGATGRLDLPSLHAGSVVLDLTRLDGMGHYTIRGSVDPSAIDATVQADEPAGGLLSGLAGLPDLGALSAKITLAGPQSAERLQLALSAGPLRANGTGTINLTGQAIDLDLSATASAMTPRPDISWQAVTIDTHVHGPWTSPTASGHAEIDGLAAAGATVAKIVAELHGNGGAATLTAMLNGVRIPGPQPDLLAQAPVTLQADAVLNTPARPVTFTLSHPLLLLQGHVDTGTEIAGAVTATIPALGPLAAIGGVDLQGRAAVTTKFAVHDSGVSVTTDGTIGVTGGLPMAVGLLGDNATVGVGVVLAGQDVSVDHLTLDGKTLKVSASGWVRSGTIDLAWQVALADLSRLAPTLAGTLAAKGTVKGPQQNFAVDAAAAGDIAAAGVPKGPLSVSLHADGLPGSPTGHIEATGQLAGAPLALTASAVRRADGNLQVSITRAAWKSAEAKGELGLSPGATLPVGQVNLRISRLADLAPFVGQPIGGSLDATFDTTASGGKPVARLKLDGSQLAASGASIGRLTLAGTIDDPVAHPVLDLTVGVDGIAASGFTGNAQLGAKGALDALALRLAADLHGANGDPVRLSTNVTTNLTKRDLQVSTLEAVYGGDTARLLGPARVQLADGVAIDGLRIGIGQAVLSASGRVMPTLGLTVSLRNATPDLAKPFAPGLMAEGTIGLDARLAGTIAAPEGTVQVTGRRLRLASGPGRAVPAADLDASAELRRTTAQLTARVAAGKAVQLQIAGTVPLQPTGTADLHATGTVDLGVLDPLLTANGRNLRGTVTLSAGIAGSVAAPRLSGTLQLARGEFQDFVQGVHLTDMAGAVQADGETLRIARLTGRAGPGTFTVAGTVALAAAGMPVDLTITGRDIRPLASDLVTAQLDEDLTVHGQATGHLDLAGRVHIRHADITIPDSFPTSVAVLNVRRRGQKPPPPAAPGVVVGLDVKVDAPGQIFVRGHGLDAEMGGTLSIGGSSTAPRIGGGLQMRRGTFSLAGQTLNFTTGKVGFDGSGPSGKLDPTIDFVAQAIASSITATLEVSGYADAPKIKLSSSPDMPQDEVLAQLLFGQSVKQLSPFQLAEIGQALASMTGVGGGIDPLATARKSLGLDRLSVGGASGNATGATVEAGKYVANGVYVGTKQGTSGGTQAQVQIDLTKNLKVQTTLGVGGGTPATGATPDNDPGSSIGLSYQFDY